MFPDFKTTIETTPSIRPHKSNLSVIWWGDATYSIDDTEKMIADAQLTVAEQKRRIRNLEFRQLTEASATPL